MIFVLVILTFVVGISISAFQESREKRAQETKTTLGLAPSPALVRVSDTAAQRYEPKTGNLWVG